MIEKHRQEMPKVDPNIRPIPKRKTWREDLAEKYLKPKGIDEAFGKEESDWVDVDSSGDDIINEGGQTENPTSWNVENTEISTKSGILVIQAKTSGQYGTEIKLNDKIVKIQPDSHVGEHHQGL